MHPPERRAARHRRRVALALGLLVFGWAASGHVAAWLLTHRIGGAGPEPAPDGLEAVRLTTVDGLSIGGWWSHDAAARVGVVLAHGNGGSRSALRDDIAAFRALGADVLAITLRAHGDSDGAENDLGWSARHDITAAAQHLGRFSSGRPTIAYGVSLGSAAAVFAGAEEHAPLDGYVLVAPYADLRLAVERRTDRYLPPILAECAYFGLRLGALTVLPGLERIRPAAAAARVPARAPMLVVSGRDDSRAPVSDGEAFVRAHTRSQLVVVEHAEHEAMGRFARSPAGRAALEPFLGEVLAGDTIAQ